MSYNGSGVYIAPAGQPVVSGTVIQSSTFNTYVADVTATFNNTLTRDGQGVVTGPFKLFSGTVSVPGLSFNSESSTGLFWPSAGNLAFTVQGVEPMRLKTSGAVLIGTSTDDAVNKLQVTGGTALTGALNVTGNAGVGGGLTVTGNAAVGNLLTVTGNETIGGALTVTGNAAIGNLLTVTGAATIGTTLGVSGATGLNTLTTAGVATLNSLGVTNNATIGGTLSVTGVITGRASLNLPLTGGTLSGALSVAVSTNAASPLLTLTNPNVGAAAASRLSMTSDTGSFTIDCYSAAFSAGDTWMYTVGAKALVFGTNSTERMRLDSAGNLGIGGTAANRLDVFHTVTGIGARVRNTSTGVELAIRTDAATAGLDAGNTSGGITFSINAVEKMRMDTTGNLGIGTSTVLTGVKLNVAGGISTNGLNVAGTGGVYNAANKVGIDNNAGQTRIYSSGPNSATRGSYDFRITDSVGTLDQSAMQIDNTGNVGIGGSSAGGKLELLTASGDPYLRITNGTQQAFMQARGTSSLVALGSLSNSDVAVYTNNTEKVRVDVSGNVGIGGTPVGAIGKLHVFGGITSTTGMNVAGNGGFYNAANKFGVDNNVGATRMYASGPNTATKGSFELHGITSDGSIDTVHLTVTAAGVIQDSAANELGFKGLPSASVTTGAFAAADRGKCVYATAGVTIPNATMAVGDVVTIINTTAAAITLTATVTTLRQAGTANTGNRTLAAYGIATVIFVSSTLGFISGTGLT